MMGFYPFVRIFLFYLSGILLGLFFRPDPYFCISISTAAAIFTCFSEINRRYRHRSLFGVSALLTFLFTGAGWTSIGMMKEIPEPMTAEKESILAVRLLENPSEKMNTFHCVASLLYVDSVIIERDLKVMVYFEKATRVKQLRYGQIIIIEGTARAPQEPFNPKDFNYREYLANRGIFFSVYADSNAWVESGCRVLNPVFLVAGILQNELINALVESGLQGDQLGISAAMLFGDRDYLDREVSSKFANAGAVHILCVSGLHVGILFVLSTMLLSFVKRNLFRNILVMGIIWAFALVSGMAAPVMRAAVMFSVILICRSSGREPNIFNTISISAFILLTVYPKLIMQAGFQLSYSALLGIVIFQPFLSNFWLPRYKLMMKCRDLVCVSVAAQIGTLPLSISYFNQFPNYFIMTNLLVIPMTGLIIYTGLLVSFLAVLGFVIRPLSSAFFFQLEALEYFVTKISDLPGAVTQIYWAEKYAMLILFAAIVMLGAWVLSTKRNFLLLAMVMALFLETRLLLNKFDNLLLRELIIFNSGKGLLISIADQGHQHFIADSAALSDPYVTSTVRSHSLYGLKTKLHRLTDRTRDGGLVMVSGFVCTGAHSLLIMGEQGSKHIPPGIEIDALVVREGISRDYDSDPEKVRLSNIILLNGLKNMDYTFWKQYSLDHDIQIHRLDKQGAFIKREHDKDAMLPSYLRLIFSLF